MKNWLVVSVLALLVAGLALPILADEGEKKVDKGEVEKKVDKEEGEKKVDKEEVAKKVVAALEKVKKTLAEACTAAETKTGGKAVAGKLEIEDDELEYEVIVAVVKDKELTFHEVDVDAVTGKVLEDETMNGDDDDEKGDDDKDDGDDDDGEDED